MPLFGTSSSIAAQSEINTSQDKVVASPPEDSVSDLSFSPRADLLSVASWDKKVRIYEVLNTGDTQGRAMYEHEAPVLSSQWFPDGSKLVSGGCDNVVKVYDLQSSQSAPVGQHSSAVSCVRVVEVAGSALVASCSWDKTLKYWDMRSNQPVATVQLPERAYTMDSQKNLLVVGTAERHLCVIDLSNPGEIFNRLPSPLKYQTRVISCYPNGTGYAVGSVEGRCAIQYVDANEQKLNGFSFKCHRDTQGPPRNETHVYPLNAISFHPVYGTFSTAGSDGTFHIWDKDSKYRLKGSGKVGGSISATAFNSTGSIFAYAVSYDWSKGHQFNNPQYPNLIKLHPMTDAECKQRPKKK